MKNIANYNNDNVGYKETRPNNYQNYRRQNFQYRQNNGYQNRNQNQNYGRNRSNGRIRKSLEGQWLGEDNTNQARTEQHQQNRKQETPTQTVINGQSNESCKKTCIKIVGHIRKLKQDYDIPKKN